MEFGILFLWLIIIMSMFRKNKTVKYVLEKKENTGGNKEMYEQAKRYLNKDCFIDILNGQATGIITEVTDGAITIEDINGQGKKVLNMEYVISIMEYPKNKKGKRKAIW